jgi:D-serine deaminase-like pyridoxal phosphate-dependent protein
MPLRSTFWLRSSATSKLPLIKLNLWGMRNYCVMAAALLGLTRRSSMRAASLPLRSLSMAASSLPLTSLRTPAYVVDLAVARTNAERMLETAQAMGLECRPHVKTHKTEELALLQTGGRRGRITVSTLAEAEFYADHGFDDIVYAVPITPEKVAAAAALSARLDKFVVAVDNEQQVDALLAHGPPSAAGDPEKPWRVVLMVDCGYHREGLDPRAPASVDLARRLVAGGRIAVLEGVYTHGGNSYDARGAAAVRAIARDERDAVVALAGALEAAGVPCPDRGVGSTPTCASLLRESPLSPPSEEANGDEAFAAYRSEISEGLTELHPGNYVFFDTAQLSIGACASPDDIAVRVVTRVVGHYPGSNTLLVDMGWTAQGGGQGGQDADHPFGCFTHRLVPPPPPAPWPAQAEEGGSDGGSGGSWAEDRSAAVLNLKINNLKQEVGEVSTKDGTPLDFEALPVGSLLCFAPHHSCATGHNHQTIKVLEGGRIVDEYDVCKGW